MIVVVEGISAAGKSTWAAQHAPAVVQENRAVPEQGLDVEATGRFWSDRHSERWLHALALEGQHPWVCLDTDALKIHYGWCLWQLGLDSRAAWMANVVSTREHLQQQRLGFADGIAFLEPPEAVVRQHKARDTTRRRGNFDTHVRLYAPLRRWYGLLEDLAPGRVCFQAQAMQGAWPWQPRADRYDLGLFDALVDAADRAPV